MALNNVSKLSVNGGGWLALAAALLALSLTACTGSQSNGPAVRQPTVVLNFGELSDDERVILEKRLSESPDFRLSCRANEDRLMCEPGLAQRDWSPSEIFGFARDLHTFVASSTNLSGGLLAHNQSVNIELNYTNTRAESVTGAVIFITPAPEGALLFIDSPVPGIQKLKTDAGHVQLNEDGQFSLNLPFSFIRQSRYIYFRSVYEGATRYFYYDLEREQQFEVGGVRSAEDWAYYQQHHALP